MQWHSRFAALAGTTLVGVVTTNTLSLAAAESFEAAPQISYVLEPFDSRWATGEASTHIVLGNDDNENDGVIRRSADDFAVGEAATAIHLKPAAASSTSTTTSFGWTLFPSEASHNCEGADYLSLWYKVPAGETNSPTAITTKNNNGLTLSISLGDSRTAVNDPDEQFWTRNAIELSNNESGWTEIQFPLDNNDLWSYGTNASNVRALSEVLFDIRLVLIHITVPLGDNGTQTQRVLLDHMSCVGNGNLLGNALRSYPTFREAANANIFFDYIPGDPLNTNPTRMTISDGGQLGIDYAVEMTDTWGGLVAVSHVAPANSYFNLSLADEIGFQYQVQTVASEPDRVHLRLMLWDTSHCLGNCTQSGNNEVYYSFQHILDSDESMTEAKLAPVVLTSEEHAASRFCRPGWAGVAGNDNLDTSYIKAYNLEISLNENGFLGDIVTGAITVSNIAAGRSVDVEGNPSNHERMRRDDNIQLVVSSETFTSVQFKGEQCAETCANQPDCLFAVRRRFGDPYNCYLASNITRANIQLESADVLPATSFWKDDAATRGDFCDKCRCVGTSGTIDCRGANLAILPKTFTPKNEDWVPATLDLRDNPNLVYIGEGSLSSGSWAKSLQGMWLPQTLVYIAPDNLQVSASLKVMNNAEDDSRRAGFNFVQGPDETFGHVCCNRDEDAREGSPGFCQMGKDTIGGDSLYFPFISYANKEFVVVLQEDSPFLSEAAQSVEKCAEACEITANCRYFTYDSRIIKPLPSCELLSMVSNEMTSCCNRSDFSDEAQSIPGVISGRTPSARHIIDNAKVLVDARTLQLDGSNGYTTTYTVSLGAEPLRGAVWIDPMVAAESSMEVSVFPDRVALYDSNSTASITVKVTNSKKGTVVISHSISSCDAAFMSFPTLEESTMPVFVNVSISVSSKTQWIIVGVVLVGIAVLLVVGSFLVVELRKRDNDNAWRVKLKELHFGDPPEILGRGSFGLVILADYRGTQVAVKRVIPGDKSKPNPVESMSDSLPTAPLYRLFSTNGAESQGSGSQGGQSQFGVNSNFLHAGSIVRRDRVRLENEFISEMRLLSKLRHPCVTTVMGAVLQRGHEPMLVLELMEGGSLHDLLLNDSVFLDGERLLHIVRDIASGMRFLHTASPQVVHGDLKSYNILVDKRFRSKVADFGLSQKQQLGAVGTPYWMAPELLRGETCNTAASDVYSFGVVLFEIYSREDPYRGEDTREVLMLVGDPNVNKRPQIPRCCPPRAKSIMLECFSGESSLRPSFEEIDDRVKAYSPTDFSPIGDGDTTRTEVSESYTDTDHFPLKKIGERPPEPKFSDCTSVLVADFIGYQEAESNLPPESLTALKASVSEKLNKLAEKHGVFSVDTTGATFMGITNLMKQQPDHASRMARFAMDAIQAVSLISISDGSVETNNRQDQLNLRIGIHCGPIVANAVVRNEHIHYSVIGGTVTTAYFLKDSSYTNRVLCSKKFVELIRDNPALTTEVSVESRGKIETRSSDLLDAFWLRPL